MDIEDRVSTATAIGTQMPAVITIDDVARMSEADEHHRYELSREGVLSVRPPVTPEHMMLVSRLMHWFFIHGYGPEQVVAECGIDVGDGRVGGRQPDLTIWAKGQPPRRGRSSYAGLDGLLLAIEVISTDSVLIDRVVKKAEYAAAGVPRYWFVERDARNTVHLHQLVNGEFVEHRTASLDQLLTDPVELM